MFRRQKNVGVILGEATSVDLEDRTIAVDGQQLPFDYLVLATGSTHRYFGNDLWEPGAPGLKSIDDALQIRCRFLLAFERAERCTDSEERRRLPTTVIVGGGPTGIELAGAMSEVANQVLQGEFRSLDPSSLKIVLGEGADRLLPARAEIDECRLRGNASPGPAPMHRVADLKGAEGVRSGEAQMHRAVLRLVRQAKTRSIIDRGVIEPQGSASYLNVAGAQPGLRIDRAKNTGANVRGFVKLDSRRHA